MRSYISKEMKRFNHLLGEINAVYHEAALKLGLSDSAMGILYTVCSEGESCLLQDICKLSGLSKQTVNSAIRKLEKEDIIYLEPVSTKAKRVFLTEKGKDLANRTAVKVIRMENDVFASWRAEDVENYLQLTEKYMNDFKQKISEIQEGL